MRALLHYLATLVVIPVYGIQVCPYIDSLQPLQVIIPVSVALALQFALRSVLIQRVVATAPLETRVNRAFWLELSLFTATAIALMLYNTWMYAF
ncbi:MAG: hypothetical protein KAI28_00165, partial [Sphingomonadales bacterium]|nr:hypothetical protein [Sphingomonadales bacterium]